MGWRDQGIRDTIVLHRTFRRSLSSHCLAENWVDLSQDRGSQILGEILVENSSGEVSYRRIILAKIKFEVYCGTRDDEAGDSF